jgi:hypothetical protein
MARAIWVAGLFGSLFVGSACGGPSQEAGSPDVAVNRAVVDAAQSWLAKLDEGNYDGSWNDSATVFRIGNGTSANWANAAMEMRGPLGRVVSRKLKDAQPTNLQEGAAYALVYDTSFEARPSSVEEVTLMLDGGFWKVAGYTVK